MLAYFLIGVITLLAYILLFKGRPNNFPPGPKGWPIVGNMFQLGNDQHEKYFEMGKTYGHILGFQFGPSNVVVLNNYKLIKEAFNETAFTGRPILGIVEVRNRGGLRGVIFNHGNRWQEQRRFSLKNLRDFGFGKKSMEVLVMEEVNELVQSLTKTNGAPMSTQNRFNAAVLNALWQIVTGQRYPQDDPKLLEFFKQITSIIAAPSLFIVWGQFFPSITKLQSIFPALFPDKLEEFVDPVYTFFDSIVEEHKRTLEEGNPRDFIDVYLEVMANSTDPSSSFYGAEGVKTLPVVMLDLFIAGAETTSSTLSWACMILALHPQAQRKLQSEIAKCAGTSRHVSLTDRPQLVYLEAVIMEVMRFASLTPVGVPHAALEDTTFHGYNIPKGTQIIANLYSALRDKDAWGDPENFRPERFLSQDGKTLVRNEAHIPFSIGRRICLGQTLALDELFLFMGNLFQRFEIETVGKIEAPFAKEINFMVRFPKPHELRFIDRLK